MKLNEDTANDIVAYRLHQSEDTGGDIDSVTFEGLSLRHHRDGFKTPAVDNKGSLKWNGEGLPPVGAEFEFGDHRSKARCLGVGSEMVFACWGDPEDEDGDYEEFLISIAHSTFYPVRTEEEVMQETIETSLRTCLAGTGAGITKLAAKGLYQAIANGSIPGVGLIKDK